MRTSSTGRLFLVVCVAVLASACFDDRTADECSYIGTCPLPDADAGVIVVQAPPAPCAGQCVPPGPEGWYPPSLVFMGPKPSTTLRCPDPTTPWYDGVAMPAAPVCGACACQPSTGSCVLPATVTAHADQCPGTGAGTIFDPPSAWDGSCAAPPTIAGGVQSVTVAPLAVNDACAPVTPTASDPPPPPPIVLACGSTMASGTCAAPADVCLPTEQTWMVCISHAGAGDEETAACPKGPYKELYVVADAFTEPACSPCTCGSPEGSACGASLVSFYTDDACSDPIAAVTVEASASTCVDVPSSAPLGSVSASAPTYTPGTCAASGSALTGPPIPDAPTTLCCLKQTNFP
jgi:hypothetical protein